MSLRKSASREVQVLSRYLGKDVQSVTGRNLRLIQETVKLNPWNISNNKLKMALISAETVEVSMVDRWRLPYLCTLLSQRREASNNALEEEEKRINELIESLVLN